MGQRAGRLKCSKSARFRTIRLVSPGLGSGATAAWHPPRSPGILDSVRWVVAASLVLSATALARAPRRPAPPVEPEPRFWRDIAEPHASQIQPILAKAQAALGQYASVLYGDYDPAAMRRALRDVYGMLRYAHALAPDNVDVLIALGHAADELGKTDVAIDALTAAIHQVGLDRAKPEVTGRLGAIYLRLGRTDDALRYLRLAQGPVVMGQPLSAQVLVHLANALASRDRMDEAIDVLASGLAGQAMSYSNESALVAFALAVQYDRDEQRGAAFEVLDRLGVQLQGTIGQMVQTSIATMRFAPAEDEHYYRGMLYEVAGSPGEARAEWALYAASDGPWRRRALAHLAALSTPAPAPRPVKPTHAPPAPGPLVPPP